MSSSSPSDKFEDMAWEQYFEKNKGQPVRPLDAQAMDYVSHSDSKKLTAIDIGCGAGIETSDLLRRGWRVIAIDQEPSSIAAVLELSKMQTNLKLTMICSSSEDLLSLTSAEFRFSYHSLPFC